MPGIRPRTSDSGCRREGDPPRQSTPLLRLNGYPHSAFSARSELNRRPLMRPKGPRCQNLQPASPRAQCGWPRHSADDRPVVTGVSRECQASQASGRTSPLSTSGRVVTPRSRDGEVVIDRAIDPTQGPDGHRWRTRGIGRGHLGRQAEMAQNGVARTRLLDERDQPQTPPASRAGQDVPSAVWPVTPRTATLPGDIRFEASTMTHVDVTRMRVFETWVIGGGRSAMRSPTADWQSAIADSITGHRSPIAGPASSSLPHPA